MPLTPADVHNVVFKKPPMGKRGYDEDEVDAFLDVVEAELARLVEENNELRASRADVGADERPGAPAACCAAARGPAAGGRQRACLADAGSGDRDGRPVRRRGRAAGRADDGQCQGHVPADGQPG